jgi:BirA family biotin operon repressor/biotin-[acetyl-CoA-carboxylase] ligase
MIENVLSLKRKEKKEEDGRHNIHHLNGTIIIAEHQRRGRGRHRERQWISPIGGIWLSVILVPKISPVYSPFLSFSSAIAVCDAINQSTNLNSRIKWPNDIVIQGKKVSGILVNLSAEGQKISYAVIGIGINANISISALCSEILRKGGNNPECPSSYAGVTSLKYELGNTAVDIVGIIQLILEKLEHYYLSLESEGPENIRQEWKKRAETLGKFVEVEREDNNVVRGIAIDIDSDGKLLVRTQDGSIHEIL